MPHPFIIWAATRTASTSLARATGAENEPFHFGPPANRLHPVYERWKTNGDALVLGGDCFKHLPEWFEDGFNVALAKAATGYRHIHLVRLSELDRLISNDIAGQLDAWWPEEARIRFAEVRIGGRVLNPLDVPRLIENARRIRRAWQAVEPHLAPVLTVLQEHLTSRDIDIRQATLRRLTAFLGLPSDSLSDLDLSIRSGDQKTRQVRDMVPNIGELRTTLLAEGLV